MNEEINMQIAAAVAGMPPPEPVQRPRLWAPVGLWLHLGLMLVLGTLVLLVYANTFTTGFALDDKQLLLEDTRLREATEANVQKILTEDYWAPRSSGLYRPMTTLSYLFNYSLLDGKTWPAGYHLTNFLLHWLNAVLAYLVVLVLMGNVWPAFFTAAIFAVHPVNTEAVTNIVGRPELLAAFGVLAGFLMYARSTLAPGGQKVFWLGGVFVCSLVAVFSKENGLVLGALIVFYDLLYRMPDMTGRTAGQKLRAVVPGWLVWAPAAVFWYVARGLVLAKSPLPEILAVDNPLVKAEFWTAKLTALGVVGRYIGLLLLPLRLSVDYSYNQIPLADWKFWHWNTMIGLIALVVVALGVLAAVRHWRRDRAVTLFILLFFVALLPASNLIITIGTIMAERFLYLPSLAFAGVLVWAVYAVTRTVVTKLVFMEWAMAFWLQIAARTVLTVVLVGFGARAFLRNFAWEDEIKLWESATRAAPDSYKPHKALAYAMYERDLKDGQPTRNIDMVIQEAQKALDITDESPTLLLHLGHYYRVKADASVNRAPDGTYVVSPTVRPWYTKSVDLLRHAAQLDQQSNNENRQRELARGRREDAIHDIGNHEIYRNLGDTYARLGQYPEAIDAFSYMRQLAPGNPDAYLSIASVHLMNRQYPEASVALTQALLLDETRAEAMASLIEVYRRIDPQGCAVEFSRGQNRLNRDCAIVREGFCRAFAGLAEVYRKAKDYELAQQARDTALAKYNCDAAVFKQINPAKSP